MLCVVRVFVADVSIKAANISEISPKINKLPIAELELVLEKENSGGESRGAG
jgi:hypothetical protein